MLTARYSQPRWLGWLRTVAMWLALAMIVMACPPFNYIIDAVFGVAFVLWLIAWNRAAQTRARARLQISATSVLVLLLLTLLVVELFHRRIPVIRGRVSDHLVVIGDSISSGLGSRVRPWPALLQQMTGVEVKNLSKPGASMADGLTMAERVGPEDDLILIELGGNDLIAGEPSTTFAQGLQEVLAKLVAPGRTMVMFELPLLPDRIAYGQIQRRLAAKYGVWLIPKRCLAGIIMHRDATSDGLHLSDAGSRRMALLVAQVLSPVLQAHPGATTPATHP